MFNGPPSGHDNTWAQVPLESAQMQPVANVMPAWFWRLHRRYKDDEGGKGAMSILEELRTQQRQDRRRALARIRSRHRSLETRTSLQMARRNTPISGEIDRLRSSPTLVTGGWSDKMAQKGALPNILV